MRSPEFNTTDYLIELGNFLAEENIDEKKVLDILSDIQDFHKEVSCKKLSQYDINIEKYIDTFFVDIAKNIRFYIHQKDKEIIPSIENDYSIIDKAGNTISLLWFWEKVSSEILSHVVSQIMSDIKSVSIDLWSLTITDETIHLWQSEIFSLLEEKIFEATKTRIDNKEIPILSGFIWSLNGWIENAIGRWYSDATAAICVVGYAHKWYTWVLEIQKSVILIFPSCLL